MRESNFGIAAATTAFSMLRDDFRTAPDSRYWPGPCEKVMMLDRHRTNYSFKAAFGAHTRADSSLRQTPRMSFSSRFDF
jgi:hypothetical protein